jgi:type IV pilus assembly protein PilA
VLAQGLVTGCVAFVRWGGQSSRVLAADGLARGVHLYQGNVFLCSTSYWSLSMKRTMQKGFTLIELMIVVAIIGILAAVALPAYQDYTIRAQLSESQSLAGGLQRAVEDYFAASGAFPTSNEKAVCGDNGVTNCSGYKEDDNKGNYVDQITVVAGGGLNIRMGNKANASIKGKLVSLRPGLDPASNVSWICGKSAVPAGVTVSAADSTNVNLKYLSNSCK